jgi:hypothetical protein
MAEEFLEKTNVVATRHETSDINPRAVASFGAALIITFAMIFFGLRGLIDYFGGQHPTSMTAVRINASRTLPPEPRLQSNPASDMERFRAGENRILNSYGWIDRPAEIVRIPIERAMDIIVERGLSTPQPGSGKTPLQMLQEKANPEKPSP